MPPPKSKSNPDDSKSEVSGVKDRNGHGLKESHQTNGKLRRVASSTGSQLREVTSVNGNSLPAPTAAVTPAGLLPPGVWDTNSNNYVSVGLTWNSFSS